MRIKILFYFLIMIFCVYTYADPHPEKIIANYFKSIHQDPDKVLIFLKNMPKGGDLHYHGGGGSSMSENLLRYGSGESFCIDPKTFITYKNALCNKKNSLEGALANKNFYEKINRAWSMRDFHSNTETAHHHFFSTFAKFDALATFNLAEILAENTNRAGEQNISYLEIMLIPDNNAAGKLGSELKFHPQFTQLQQTLLTKGITDIVAQMQKDMTMIENKKMKILHCGTSSAAPGCFVKTYYQYVVLREQPPQNVFAALFAAFLLVNQDPRFVGINLAQPEDGPIAMRDYHLHMQMIDFFHSLYPRVHIALHAGELNKTLVPSEGLTFHIRDAIKTGHAERIGHGVSISSEDNAEQLLQEMVAKNIMVEINLSSNATILNISGEEHSLPLYLHYGVPVALSTDDEGILRTRLTTEYQKAILQYQLDYSTLKKLVRNSIYYSFIPGNHLWKNSNYLSFHDACKKDNVTSLSISKNCQAYLTMHEKANMEWDLEKRFSEFEKSFARHYL